MVYQHQHPLSRSDMELWPFMLCSQMSSISPHLTIRDHTDSNAGQDSQQCTNR